MNTVSNKTTFALGAICMTQGVAESLPRHLVALAIARHAQCDWNEMAEEDRRCNQGAVERGGRIFSAYTLGGYDVWVITDSDRTVTTVLFPMEY